MTRPLTEAASFISPMRLMSPDGTLRTADRTPESPLLGVERRCSRRVSKSAFDAVDGSSTGTCVPWLWALLRLPRFRRSEPCRHAVSAEQSMMRLTRATKADPTQRIASCRKRT